MSNHCSFFVNIYCLVYNIFGVDKNMKLKRIYLIEYEKNWNKGHLIKNDNPEEYISFLEGLYNIIIKYDYEQDDRFVLFGRREFLKNGFNDYLNDTEFSVRGKFNDAYIDFTDFLLGNTWIDLAYIPTNLDVDTVLKNDDNYKDDGNICKQEIDVIKEMLLTFKGHLLALRDNHMSNLNNIPDKLKGYVYFCNGNIYKKQMFPIKLNQEFQNFKSKVNDLSCPICGELLMYSMLGVLHCKICNKYFVYNNNKVGNEIDCPQVSLDEDY